MLFFALLAMASACKWPWQRGGDEEAAIGALPEIPVLPDLGGAADGLPATGGTSGGCAASVFAEASVNNGTFQIDDDIAFAQSIVPASNLSLSSVTLKMVQSNGGLLSQGLRIKVQSNANLGCWGIANCPSGGTLGTSEVVPPAAMPFGSFWALEDVEFVFSTPVSLTAGTRYWLILEAPIHGQGVEINIAYGDPSDYAAGVMTFGFLDGIYYGLGNGADMLFQAKACN
ncbi:MAG: hypothetical protein AB7P04_04380 [Bacteriovoracia bacterium]